jgi:hypothetical protein
MERNMSGDADKNLGIVRGALWGKVRCQRATREQLVAARTQARRNWKDRSLECVAAGVTNPGGEVVKLIYRLRAAGVSMQSTRAIAIEPLERELEIAFALKPAA